LPNHKKLKIAAVIPARYQSTRFEGKPLAKILGKPMVLHVYDNIKSCPVLDEVIIATEDERIVDVVLEYGAKAMMTRDDHPTGTDRIAEVSAKIDADIIINVQGDEPLINVEMIQKMAEPLIEDKTIDVANMITTISNIGDYIDTTVVKAVKDKKEFLLYLTRSPIPYPKTRQNYVVYKQIGLYAFRSNFLQKFVSMPQTDLELIEGIEFLRILENGYKVKAVVGDYTMISVDTISDLIEVEKKLKELQVHV